MNCETCNNPACACTSEWLNDKAMVVRYWCKEHAPEDAEYFNSETKKIFDCGIVNGTQLTYVNGGLYATPARKKRKQRGTMPKSINSN